MFFSHKQLLRDEHVYSTPSVSLTVVAVVTPVHFRVNTKTQVFVGFPRYEITPAGKGCEGCEGFFITVTLWPHLRGIHQMRGVYILYTVGEGERVNIVCRVRTMYKPQSRCHSFKSQTFCCPRKLVNNVWVVCSPLF